MPWMSTKRGRLLDLSSLLSSDHRPFLQYLGVRFRSIFRRRHRVVEERKTTDVSYEKSSHSAGSITALETLALHIPRAVFGAFRGVGKPLSGWWVVGGISESTRPPLDSVVFDPPLDIAQRSSPELLESNRASSSVANIIAENATPIEDGVTWKGGVTLEVSGCAGDDRHHRDDLQVQGRE